jgi:Rieske Fe-S protein
MVNRRTALAALGQTIFGAIASVLAFVLGGAATRPASAGRGEAWADAGSLDALADGVPREVVIGVERIDGYYAVTERRIVYLVRQGGQVRAFSTVCTHLGCRVVWRPDAARFRCPCHGGEYALDGRVLAGPPPRGLDELPLRVEGGQAQVRLG